MFPVIDNTRVDKFTYKKQLSHVSHSISISLTDHLAKTGTRASEDKVVTFVRRNEHF